MDGVSDSYSNVTCKGDGIKVKFSLQTVHWSMISLPRCLMGPVFYEEFRCLKGISTISSQLTLLFPPVPPCQLRKVEHLLCNLPSLQ